MENHVEEPIILGIRSEDIFDKIKRGTSENEFAVFPCTIKFVEELGNEKFAFAHLNNKEIVARLKPNAEINIDKPTNLFLSIKKMHFFNQQTKLALGVVTK